MYWVISCEDRNYHVIVTGPYGNIKQLTSVKWGRIYGIKEDTDNYKFCR